MNRTRVALRLVNIGRLLYQQTFGIGFKRLPNKLGSGA